MAERVLHVLGTYCHVELLTTSMNFTALLHSAFMCAVMHCVLLLS